MKYQDSILYAYQEGYRITREGQVVSRNGKLRKICISKRGYAAFSIASPRRKVLRIEVHKLAAYQWFGEPALKGVVRHLDGNPSNNQIENLRVGTQSENMLDRPPAARKAHAQKAANKRRRFSEEQVESIREEHEGGATYKKLSQKWQVGKGVLSYLLSNKAKRRACY
jgi:hypothetical protein